LLGLFFISLEPASTLICCQQPLLILGLVIGRHLKFAILFGLVDSSSWVESLTFPFVGSKGRFLYSLFPQNNVVTPAVAGTLVAVVDYLGKVLHHNHDRQ